MEKNTIHRRNRLRSPILRARLAEMRSQRRTLREIAAEFGVAFSTAARWCNTMSLKKPKRDTSNDKAKITITLPKSLLDSIDGLCVDGETRSSVVRKALVKALNDVTLIEHPLRLKRTCQ